jgi:hypothetical protein
VFNGNRIGQATALIVAGSGGGAGSNQGGAGGNGGDANGGMTAVGYTPTTQPCLGQGATSTGGGAPAGTADTQGSAGLALLGGRAGNYGAGGGAGFWGGGGGGHCPNGARSSLANYCKQRHGALTVTCFSHAPTPYPAPHPTDNNTITTNTTTTTLSSHAMPCFGGPVNGRCHSSV